VRRLDHLAGGVLGLERGEQPLVGSGSCVRTGTPLPWSWVWCSARTTSLSTRCATTRSARAPSWPRSGTCGPSTQGGEPAADGSAGPRGPSRCGRAPRSGCVVGDLALRPEISGVVAGRASAGYGPASPTGESGSAAGGTAAGRVSL
jgi:hypothetical protein